MFKVCLGDLVFSTVRVTPFSNIFALQLLLAPSSLGLVCSELIILGLYFVVLFELFYFWFFVKDLYLFEWLFIPFVFLLLVLLFLCRLVSIEH